MTYDGIVASLGIRQQDSPDAPLDPLVRVLISLQESDCSVFWRRADNELNVSPIPSEDVRFEIEEHYEEMRTLLPGFCEGCGLWVIRRFESYWGAHPHLCRSCVDRSVETFERRNMWPSVDVPNLS